MSVDYALSALSLDGARLVRGALTYCDGQARGESAPGSHNSTSISVRLILALLAPSLEPAVDSVLVLMLVLLVPKVVRCGALLSPGVQPTLSHGQRSGV